MLAELLNSPQGQGLLAAAFGAAASARRGAPFNTLGAGGLAGLSAFANAQDRITQQKQDALRQDYVRAQTGHLAQQTLDQQRKAKAAEEQQAWLKTQNPAMLATGGNMAPTTENAQRLSQVDPRQQQMWDLAARGLLPFDKYLEMTAPQKPQHKVVGNTLLEVGGQGVKPLYTAPDAGKMSPLGQLYAEMEKLPAGSPQRAAYQAAITKATTHHPGTNVSVNMGQKGFDNTLKLRGDFRSEPIYKAHQDVQSAHAQITQAIKQASPAGDLAAATKIMKILDPGSVVRESELGMAMAATGVLDRIQNYAAMTINGTKLTPAQRNDFKALADRLFDESSKQYNAKRSEYEGIAKRNGLSVEDALGPASNYGAPAGPVPPQPNTQHRSSGAVSNGGWSIVPVN